MNPHLDTLHVLNNLRIPGGFVMLASARRILHKAQQQREWLRDAIYVGTRRPEYRAFRVAMFGFLPQWPTSRCCACCRSFATSGCALRVMGNGRRCGYARIGIAPVRYARPHSCQADIPTPPRKGRKS